MIATMTVTTQTAATGMMISRLSLSSFVCLHLLPFTHLLSQHLASTGHRESDEQKSPRQYVPLQVPPQQRSENWQSLPVEQDRPMQFVPFVHTWLQHAWPPEQSKLEVQPWPLQSFPWTHKSLQHDSSKPQADCSTQERPMQFLPWTHLLLQHTELRGHRELEEQ